MDLRAWSSNETGHKRALRTVEFNFQSLATFYSALLHYLRLATKLDHQFIDDQSLLFKDSLPKYQPYPHAIFTMLITDSILKFKFEPF